MLHVFMIRQSNKNLLVMWVVGFILSWREQITFWLDEHGRIQRLCWRGVGGLSSVYCFTSVRLTFRPSVRSSVQDIFCRIFLSNCWWQKSDIWSQASYRYPISWEAFFDLWDSYFLFAEEQGYHKWALAHSSSS